MKRLFESNRDRLKNPLFIGCVRGGLAVAKGIADYMRLNGISCELDLVIIRKLSLPTDKEMGIGAMGEDGSPWFLDDLVKKYTVDTSSPIMQQQIEEEKAELARRQALYQRERARSNLSDRTIVIVDEGLSSGATMIAAVKTIQNMCQGADIMVAVPVASRFGLNRLTNLTQIKESDLCVFGNSLYKWQNLEHYRFLQ